MMLFGLQLWLGKSMEEMQILASLVNCCVALDNLILLNLIPYLLNWDNKHLLHWTTGD